MCELCTNLAAINTSRQSQDVAQLHAFVSSTGKATGIELGIHVAFIQSEVVQFEDARRRAFHYAQRINVRYLVAAQAVNLDKAGNRCLFFARADGLVGKTCRDPAGLATIPCLQDKVLTNHRMRDFGVRIAQRLEILTPAGRNRIGSLQILLVQHFDGTCIGTEQRRGSQLFLQRNTHLFSGLKRGASLSQAQHGGNPCSH